MDNIKFLFLNVFSENILKLSKKLLNLGTFPVACRIDMLTL